MKPTNHNQISEEGFTMIELLMAVSIVSILSAMGYSFIMSGLKSTTFENEQSIAITTARRALDTMSVEIRGANDSDKGDYVISSIDKDSFVFYSDIDKDSSYEKVKYFKDNTSLKKVVYEAGLDDLYATSSATTTIAEYLNNGTEAIFSFYEGNSTSTKATLINKVRLVMISLKINVTPWRAPGDYYVTTSVKLRNLND
jgi:prepilin-type N-terminal cleavage/methylation domain-containing protein